MMEQRTQRHGLNHQCVSDEVEPDDLDEAAGAVGSLDRGHDHDGVLDDMTDR